MKTFFLISLCLIGLLLFNVQQKAIAEDGDYVFINDADSNTQGRFLIEQKDEDLTEEDNDKDIVLKARKKPKNKKGKKGPALKPDALICAPPVCEIKDSNLPDEICQNECPKGSGHHCEGRHYTKPVPLNIAFCIPD